MQPYEPEFERGVADATFVVVSSDPRLADLVVEGWEGIEGLVADEWPRISGGLMDAGAFGSEFRSLRDPGRWSRRGDGRPCALVLGNGIGDLAFAAVA